MHSYYVSGFDATIIVIIVTIISIIIIMQFIQHINLYLVLAIKTGQMVWLIATTFTKANLSFRKDSLM